MSPQCKSETNELGKQFQNNTNEVLNKIVFDAVSENVLTLYERLVEMLKCKLHIDINVFFKILAAMTIVVWAGIWYKVAKKLFCFTIPNILKRLCKGKFSFSEFELSTSSIGSAHYKSKKSSSSSSSSHCA